MCVCLYEVTVVLRLMSLRHVQELWGCNSCKITSECFYFCIIFLHSRTNMCFLHASQWKRCEYGPLTRYVKLRVAHAPGMPGTFSAPPTSKDTAMYRSRHASRHVRDARALMHVGIANPRWCGKRSRQCRHMRNPQFYVSGKRPMAR